MNEGTAASVGSTPIQSLPHLRQMVTKNVEMSGFAEGLNFRLRQLVDDLRGPTPRETESGGADELPSSPLDAIDASAERLGNELSNLENSLAELQSLL